MHRCIYLNIFILKINIEKSIIIKIYEINYICILCWAILIILTIINLKFIKSKLKQKLKIQFNLNLFLQ
jgi:hypothetical protein